MTREQPRALGLTTQSRWPWHTSAPHGAGAVPGMSRRGIRRLAILVLLAHESPGQWPHGHPSAIEAGHVSAAGVSGPS